MSAVRVLRVDKVGRQRCSRGRPGLSDEVALELVETPVVVAQETGLVNRPSPSCEQVRRPALSSTRRVHRADEAGLAWHGLV